MVIGKLPQLHFSTVYFCLLFNYSISSPGIEDVINDNEEELPQVHTLILHDVVAYYMLSPNQEPDQITPQSKQG